MTPPEGAYYLFADYRGVPALAEMSPTQIQFIADDRLEHAGNLLDRRRLPRLMVRQRPKSLPASAVSAIVRLRKAVGRPYGIADHVVPMDGQRQV